MRAAIGLMLLAASLPAVAAEYDYGLKARRIAEHTYVFVGLTEDFSLSNGGNIVNTGFIVTRDGVVVLDSGPSRRYGEQMRAAIRAVSPLPVVRVFNTHHHPDHFLGNQAYADTRLSALPATAKGIREEGAGFNDNMFRLVGNWMKDTEPLAPAADAVAGRFTLGGHEFEVLDLAGHTAGDLALFDRTTGVLFAGDLVFFDRAPTTPHADIPRWLAALDTLEKLPFRVLVPGHGEVVADRRAIAQTRDYLRWLRAELGSAAERGVSMAEAMRLPIPGRFDSLALVRSEFHRSVNHLFPALEMEALGKPPER